ncbi:transglycosylase SLT domain-containing protein [Cupriavidus necator]
MTWLATFGTDEDNANLLSQRGLTAETPEGGAFDGALVATGKGVMKGAARIGQTVAMAGTVVPIALDKVTARDNFSGSSLTDKYFTSVVDPINSSVDYWTTDARTTGSVGRVIAGLGEGLTPLLLGPETMIATAQMGATIDLAREGVDPTTAVGVGAGIGAANALGLKMGALGSTLAKKVVTGAAGNVAVGAGSDIVSSQALELRGYADQAKRFNPADPTARTLDLFMGAAFGGVAHVTGRSAAVDQDASLAARNIHHYTEQTSPGTPAGPESLTKHQAALDAAINQLMRGERVDVAKAIGGAEFRTSVPPAGRQTQVAERFTPSEALHGVPLAQRRALRFDAPELNGYAALVEQRLGLPSGILNALKNAGERSNSNQVSPAGARGVMQFMPENLRKFGVTDPTDPAQMIDAAGRYVQSTMRQYGGNLDAVIADYNGGPRQARLVMEGKTPAAEETRAYLDRVKRYLAGTIPERQAAVSARSAASIEAGRDARASLPDDLIASWGVKGADEIAAVRSHLDEIARVATAPAEVGRLDPWGGVSLREMGQARGLADAIAHVEALRAELLPAAGMAAEPGAIRALRAEIEQLRRAAPDISDEAIKARAKDLQGGEDRLSYRQALAAARKEIAALGTEHESRVTALEQQVETNRVAEQARQQLEALDRQIEGLIGVRGGLNAPPSAPRATALAARQAAAEPAGTGAARPAEGGEPAGGIPPLQESPSSTATAATPPSGAGAAPVAGPERAPAEIAAVRQALADQPDAFVIAGYDADGQPIRVRLDEALADIEAEYRADLQDAKAYDAAAACFLRNGA